MSGMVIYDGPSMIDGAHIVAVATGLEGDSRNVKTGAMVQVWILCADVAPIDAANSGADRSICGGCRHRGRVELLNGVAHNVGRSCYVTLRNAPRNVFASWQRGIYADAGDNKKRARAAAQAFCGKRVRMGAYGDPAALPIALWRQVLAGAAAFTGYTHQWRVCSRRFANYVMASCDSADDYAEAKALGYRTFRVRAAGESLASREIACPASAEAGFKTTCAACVACGGHGAKAKVDIAIVVHGAGAAAFLRSNPTQ